MPDIRNFILKQSVPQVAEQEAVEQSVKQASTNPWRDSVQRGGYVNPRSGAGTSSDRLQGFFQPTRLSQSELEVFYNENSWIKKFIDIPVDDMLIRWRSFNNLSPDESKQLHDQERIFKVREKLSNAIKAGRLYGTAFLIIVTEPDTLDTPFFVEDMQPDSLRNLMITNRFELVPSQELETDPYESNYGYPISYEWTRHRVRGGDVIRIHPSRMIRFDGITPIGSIHWNQYDHIWGVSQLVPILRYVLQDEEMCAAIAHLATEASVPVIKLQSFKEAFSTYGPEPDEMTPHQMGHQINQMRSIFKTLYMDKDDEFERINVNFGGIPALVDRFARRLAAAADIPVTRFWGQSPIGFNATGDSDMRNYAINISAQQERHLRSPMMILDAILSKNIGMSENADLSYRWHSLIDISDAEIAEISKNKAEAVKIALETGAILTEEGRKALNGDPLFGELDENVDLSPPVPLPTQPTQPNIQEIPEE